MAFSYDKDLKFKSPVQYKVQVDFLMQIDPDSMNVLNSVHLRVSENFV